MTLLCMRNTKSRCGTSGYTLKKPTARSLGETNNFFFLALKAGTETRCGDSSVIALYLLKFHAHSLMCGTEVVIASITCGPFRPLYDPLWSSTISGKNVATISKIEFH